VIRTRGYMSCEESYPQPRPASYMNYKLRRERNVFVLLVFVAVPLALLVAPLPFLESVSTKVAAERAAAQVARAQSGRSAAAGGSAAQDEKEANDAETSRR